MDFSAVAEACGLTAFRVEEPAGAATTFERAMAHQGPCLVEAVTDPYESPFGESLKPAHAEHIAERQRSDRFPYLVPV